MTREEQIQREFDAAKEKYDRDTDALRRSQQSCSHQWELPKHDPEWVKEPIMETVWQGVDCYPSFTGRYNTTIRDRWSRRCKLCEKVEYTYQKVPVEYAPKFG